MLSVTVTNLGSSAQVPSDSLPLSMATRPRTPPPVNVLTYQQQDLVDQLTETLTTIVAATFPLPPSRPASPAPAPAPAPASADNDSGPCATNDCGASNDKSRILVFLPPSHTDIDVKHVLDHARQTFKDPAVTLDQIDLQFVRISTPTPPAAAKPSPAAVATIINPPADAKPSSPPAATTKPPAHPNPSPAPAPQFKFTVANLHPSYSLTHLLSIVIPPNHAAPTSHVLQDATVAHPRLNCEVDTRTLTLGFATRALAQSCMDWIRVDMCGGKLKGLVCRGLRVNVGWVGSKHREACGAAPAQASRPLNGASGARTGSVPPNHNANGRTGSSKAQAQAQAYATGHPGHASSTHANTPRARRAPAKPNVPPLPHTSQLASVTIANIDATAHRDDVLDILLAPIRDQFPAPLGVQRLAAVPPTDPPTVGIRFAFATEAVVKRFAAYVERGVKEGEFVEITAPGMRLRVVHVEEENLVGRGLQGGGKQKGSGVTVRVASEEDALLSEFVRDLAEE